jgi:hypothetical protein
MTNIGQVRQAYLSDLSVRKRKKGDVYDFMLFFERFNILPIKASNHRRPLFYPMRILGILE